MSMSRRMWILIALLALVVGIISPVAAGAAQDDGGDGPAVEVVKSSTGSYIVVMEGDPLVVTEGRDKLNTRKAKTKGKALAKGHDKALEDAGVGAAAKVQSYTNALNGFSAIMSYEEAKEVATQDGVVLVLPDEMRYLDTDSTPTFLGLTGPASPWSTGVTGEGVIVGVIDSGIWPEHPSFADDGSYPDPGIILDETVYSACDFGNTGHNPADAPFDCNNKLIGARQILPTYRALVGAEPFEFDSARDDVGHGTHTASTAAGNSGVEASMYGQPLGTISGIAPRAHIIAYKGLGTLGGFGSDLAAAIDQAVFDGVDVINYSVGGGASLNGVDDIAYLFAADAGVFVATSAGNSGPGAATIGGPASVPWITSVGASTQTRFFQGTADLGNGSSYSGASVTPGVGTAPLVDAADHGGDLCVPGTLDAGVAGKIVLCRRGAIGRTDKSLAVDLAGGVGMILYENSDDNNLFSDTHWVPSVHVDNTPGLAIKAYISSAGASATASITTGEVAEWAPAPSVTYFSSRGPDPVAEDIIKPDVTAPGMQILAGNTPVPDPSSVPGQLFQAIAGTSMASPHVAGLFALLKQEHPDWTPAMAKSAVMTTAYQDVRDNDRVSPADPFDMGAGHVDPGNAVHKGSMFQPGLAYDAGFVDYLGFLCDADTSVFADPASTCGSLESAGISTDASDLNLASIGIAELAGTQTVTRTVTSVAQENGWRTYDVSVDAPDGYDVTVSPSRIRVKKGQSATYEVTITNNGGGPVGEWRHGSLTWNGTNGLYSVYSPISVRGALFNAPSEVIESGASGTGIFDVSFGYTGDYTAAAHGLEPAIITSDTVVQDPDQSFDPADGYSNAHAFNLTGAAHFRIEMGPGDTEVGADLDIYVYDPDGNLAASSTSGGTDELIDIVLPADGVWSVYVHGWLTPGGDSDYDMSAWVISATPGGSLSVDSAPASAVIGSTGTVEYSWTGAGGSYLGAISHSDGGGIIGLTLIAVEG